MCFSGAEDKQAYLWDRANLACVATLPHDDVVNCVCFNPVDQHTLISASDDKTVKIWRSRHRIKMLKDKSGASGLSKMPHMNTAEFT